MTYTIKQTVRELNIDELHQVAGGDAADFEVTVTASAPSSGGGSINYTNSGGGSSSGGGSASGGDQAVLNQIENNGSGVPYSPEAIFYAQRGVPYAGRPQPVNIRGTVFDLSRIAFSATGGFGPRAVVELGFQLAESMSEN